jgi:hypothetical protein
MSGKRCIALCERSFNLFRNLAFIIVNFKSMNKYFLRLRSEFAFEDGELFVLPMDMVSNRLCSV